MRDHKNKVTRDRSSTLLVYLIVAVVSFAVGMRSDVIFGTMASVLGLQVETGAVDLSTVQETYRQLKNHYDGEIDEQALIYGASQGLVAATGDTHTAYLTPEDVEELDKDISGNIGGGIGAEVGVRRNYSTIIRLLKDSPAAKVGLQADDIILAVNDQDVSNLSNEEVVRKIRGEIGTKVKILVHREQENKEFEIVREEIKMPNVEARIEGKTGILTVNLFNGETGKMARAEAEKFMTAGVDKVILDLRGNPGGEVSAAQALAGIWLDNEILITHRRGGEVIKTSRSIGKPVLNNVKTVILINGASASASEIVAGALKEYNKATLVGENTYGKGSVQHVVNLSGGAQLKVTSARWYTPKGNNIDEVGIAPDVKIKLTAEDFNNDRDPQMEKAKAL